MKGGEEEGVPPVITIPPPGSRGARIVAGNVVTTRLDYGLSATFRR